ncbi:unnamed protein product, partial [Prorocentrum cordatum]
MSSDCPVCDGSGWLIQNVSTCPLCEDGEDEHGEKGERQGQEERGGADGKESQGGVRCGAGGAARPRGNKKKTRDGAGAGAGSAAKARGGQEAARGGGGGAGDREQPGRRAWELLLDGTGWTRVQPEIEALLDEAEDAGQPTAVFRRGVHTYAVDLAQMVQVNRQTGTRRSLRRVDRQASPAGGGGSSGSAEGGPGGRDPRARGRGAAGAAAGGKGLRGRGSKGGPCAKGSRGGPRQREEEAIGGLPARSERLSRLVDRLVSPEVRVPLPADSSEEPCRLSPEEVEAVFVEHVRGVKEFVYRGQGGQYSLEFIKGAYRDGFRAFQGTDMHEHLLWLLRLIVHHGHAGGPETKRHLTDVAEAFMDCQAVQARVVERVGLQIKGVAPNFKGLVTAMVGDYKTVAIKMLAAARLQIGLASDDDAPTHYENRLTEDLGDLAGLNQDDVRRARLDEHAAARFPRLAPGPDCERALKHLKGLFDVDALVKAFISEVNSFSQDSPASSLARLFLDWACARFTEKHVVFDEDTCTSVEVGEPLALAVIEDLFLGETAAPADEVYRGLGLRALFAPPVAELPGAEAEAPAREPPHEAPAAAASPRPGAPP